MFSLSHKGSARTRLNSSLPYRKSRKPDADTSMLFSQSTRTCPRSPVMAPSPLAPPPLPPRMPLHVVVSGGACRSPRRDGHPYPHARPSPRHHRKSSLSSLSQSITGSLRIRKRRSINLKHIDSSGAKLSESRVSGQIGSTHIVGGYFETLNQSVSCVSHRGNYDARYSDDLTRMSSNLNNTLPVSKVHAHDNLDASVQTQMGANLDTSRLCEDDSGVSTGSKTLRRSTRKLNLHSKLDILSSKNRSTSSVKRRLTPDGGSDDRVLGIVGSRPHSLVSADQKNDSRIIAPEEKLALPMKVRRVLPTRPSVGNSSIIPLGPRPEPEGKSMSPPTDISKTTRATCQDNLLNDLNGPTRSGKRSHDICPNISMAWCNIEDSFCNSSRTLNSTRISASQDLSFQTIDSRSFHSSNGGDCNDSLAQSGSTLMMQIRERLDVTTAAHPTTAHGLQPDGRSVGRRYMRNEGLNQTFTQGLVSRCILIRLSTGLL